MNRYYISRGYYNVETIYIDAETEEKAMEIAEEMESDQWKQCGDIDEMLYQVEEVEENITEVEIPMFAGTKEALNKLTIRK